MAAMAELPSGRAGLPPETPQPRHVMYVEDDSEMVELTAIQLEAAGYEISFATGLAAQALAYIAGDKKKIDPSQLEKYDEKVPFEMIDLLVTDGTLLDGTSEELVKAAREKRDGTLPIIGLAGKKLPYTDVSLLKPDGLFELGSTAQNIFDSRNNSQTNDQKIH